jgi:hypothetical protein
MNPQLTEILGMVMPYINEMEEAKEEFKERTLQKWKESKNYPRKKKKKVRKILRLDWAIANWEPRY